MATVCLFQIIGALLVKCSSTVIQLGNIYTPGLHRHIHPPKQAEIHRRLLHKELKIQARRQPLAGGMEIAKGVLLQQVWPTLH